MEKDVYELTNSQKNILSVEEFYKGSSINNICGTLLINEPLNFEAFQKSICHVIEQNKSFSLKFKFENNVPKQYQSDCYYNIEHINLNTLSDLQNYKNKIARTPFDIHDNYLFKFYIFKFHNNHGGFIVNIHHLISDAWTLGLISNEIIKNYFNLINNQPLQHYTFSYLDYINSERQYLNSEKFKKDKNFWNELFTTIPDVATLPGSTEKKLSLNSCVANRKEYILDKKIVHSIHTFCKKHKVSIFNFFMAIYSIYIGRICSLNNFVIGTPILNRCNYNEKNCFGIFINTMPFKIDLQNDISFINYISDLSKNSLNMLRHQKYPYQNLLEDLRNKNDNISNLYNILLSYQITNTKNNDTNINYSTDWTFNGNCSDPINIHLFDFNDTGDLNIAYDYQTSIYNLNDINSIHSRILNIIKQVIFRPNILLKNIDIVTLEEKQKILYEFNNTLYEYDSSKTIIDLFENQVQKTPNKIALVSNNLKFTYLQLNEKANILANYLQKKHDIKPNDIIGIMLNRCPEMIIGLLAILKCGATYLPIDPEYPQERISYMLQNSRTQTVLVNDITEEYINVKYNRVNIDLSHKFYKSFSKFNNNLNTYINSDSLMYIIYTSGSTGKPKGVMITHKNVHNFLHGMKNIINFSANKVIVSLTTICFDIFGLELWCSLTSGLTFVLANEKEQNIAELLNKLCIKNKVTMFQTTPSRYMALLEDKNNIEFLKNATDIMIGGEALPQNLLSCLKEITNANIYNVYGPTETTIWSTVKNLTDTNNISIGNPIANTKCYILDKNKKLLPPYVPGELYIGGDGISKGYLRRKALTKEKFVKSPFDKESLIYNTNDLAYYTSHGEIIHLGRTDFQVKIRGYRVELGEIENRIIQFPGITNSVVISDKNNKYLLCYYTSKEDINISKLISYLLKHLPNYMIPAYFKKLEQIPLTPNGKIDRKSLPEIKENDNIELAKTNTEKIISSVLSQILNISQIDINTPFLSLGLDSLGLIQLQTALLSYNLNITTQSFYRYPSIKKLARRIDTHTEYYTEFNFQIPSQFKHHDNELNDINPNDLSDISGNILLTGANGFIGIHILHELLNTTKKKIYCFIRGENIAHSIKRLEESYNFYFNSSIEPYLNSRIIVFNGQIIQDNFNLSDEQLDELSKNVTTIIHTAAIVKHYGDFEQFKIANIDGTRRIVEFAYNNKKRLIHISSISVSGNYLVKQDNQNVLFSENDLYIGQHYTNNAYVNSKFDAEKIVYSYMEKGLTAEILRIGILSGRYSDGFFQKNINDNAFYGRIKSLIKLKSVSNEMLEQKIEFTPVDLCAKAIVLLSSSKLTENKVYHLFNHNLTTILHILNMMRTFNININTMDETSFKNYVLELSKDSKNREIFKGIVNDISFDDSHLSLNYSFTVNITSKYTQQYLKLLGFEWPEITDDYLKKILDYMKKVQFI